MAREAKGRAQCDDRGGPFPAGSFWFREAGLDSVAVTPQHEVTARGDTDFAEQILLWAKVAESRGVQMVADGYLTEAERALAEQQFRLWATDSAIRQQLYLLCVEGIVP